MRDFRQLKVWEKAHRLTLAVYANTKSFPREEIYGLTSQLRRAASSIPANIAEGAGRVGDAELARFCQLAFASANELEYHLLLARDLNYLDQARYDALLESTVEVKRMLGAFLTTIRSSKKKKLTADRLTG
jgi:four helix bundle protein